MTERRIMRRMRLNSLDFAISNVKVRHVPSLHAFEAWSCVCAMCGDWLRARPPSANNNKSLRSLWRCIIFFYSMLLLLLCLVVYREYCFSAGTFVLFERSRKKSAPRVPLWSTVAVRGRKLSPERWASNIHLQTWYDKCTSRSNDFIANRNHRPRHKRTDMTTITATIIIMNKPLDMQHTISADYIIFLFFRITLSPTPSLSWVLWSGVYSDLCDASDAHTFVAEICVFVQR